MNLVGPFQLRMFRDSVKMILKVYFNLADSVCENTNLMQGKRGFLQLHEQKLTPFALRVSFLVFLIQFS